jgi:uncharacterized protein YjbI with pentapeptide repeats
MACCMSKEYGGWCENLPIINYNSKQYCVFHAPQGGKGVSTNEFNELVFERINQAKKEKIECDLSGTIFEGDIYFRGFNKDNPLPDLKFPFVTFNGKADFMNVHFEGEAHFLKSVFCEEANFMHSIFKGKADFIICIFKNDVSFFNVEFNSEAAFISALFYSKASFCKLNFLAQAYFSLSFFEKLGTFENCNFSDKTSFSNTTFKDGFNLSNCIFQKNADLSGINCSGYANCSEVEFYCDADFKNSKFTKVDFTGAIFMGSVYFWGRTFEQFGKLQKLSIREQGRFEGTNLSNVSFIDTDVRRIDFISCIWAIKHKRDVLFDELLLFNEELYLKYYETFEESKNNKTGNKSKTSQHGPKFTEQINKLVILYRMLKQKCFNEHNYVEGSNWHYGEKEMFRKSINWRRYFPFSFSNLYWASSGYGEKPSRAFLVLLLLITVSMTLVGLLGIEHPINKLIIEIKSFSDLKLDNLTNILLAILQYSTFDKNPDFLPMSTSGKFLKIFIQILIPLQTALLVFSVRNIFRR